MGIQKNQVGLSRNICMGVGSGGQEGPWPPWIFKHGRDIVDRAK